MELIRLKNYPYEIDSEGNVYRIERRSRDGRTLHKMKLKPYKQTNGYLAVLLYYPKQDCYKKWYLHRLVYFAFYGDIPKGLVINHEDCNRENCKLENLSLVTYQGNSRNPLSLERYKAANALDKGKFNRSKMIAAKSPECREKIIKAYLQLKEKYGKVSAWTLLKQTHCNFYRAKRIIAELEAKQENNQ